MHVNVLQSDATTTESLSPSKQYKIPPPSTVPHGSPAPIGTGHVDDANSPRRRKTCSNPWNRCQTGLRSQRRRRSPGRQSQVQARHPLLPQQAPSWRTLSPPLHHSSTQTAQTPAVGHACEGWPRASRRCWHGVGQTRPQQSEEPRHGEPSEWTARCCSGARRPCVCRAGVTTGPWTTPAPHPRRRCVIGGASTASLRPGSAVVSTLARRRHIPRIVATHWARSPPQKGVHA